MTCMPRTPRQNTAVRSIDYSMRTNCVHAMSTYSHVCIYTRCIHGTGCVRTQFAPAKKQTGEYFVNLPVRRDMGPMNFNPRLGLFLVRALPVLAGFTAVQGALCLSKEPAIVPHLDGQRARYHGLLVDSSANKGCRCTESSSLHASSADPVAL